MKLQVVTCMAEKPKQNYYCWRESFASLKRFGVEPIVLGQPPYDWQWGGLASKCKFLNRAINEGIVSADYIIFTDCFDLVYSDSPEAILEAFLEIQRQARVSPRVVWGAEKACFSDASLAPYHPATPYSYKYVNTGWGIGEVEGFKAGFSEMKPDDVRDDYREPDGRWIQENDQNLWMRQMIFGSVPVAVDTGCVMVQNLCGVSASELSFEDGQKIRNIETNTVPMCWHFNGPAKTDGLREPVLKHLGLA